MTTGLPQYDIEKAMFTDVTDRRRYTQADPRGANKPADYTGTEVEYCPGTAGRNWENDAWSPRTKLLYTHTDNSCGTQVVVMGEYKPGEGYQLRRNAGGAAAVAKDVTGRPTTVPSQLIANDPIGRKTVWTRNINAGERAPVLATATDLLFHGNNATGELNALDAKTGQQVWAFRTGSMFNQSPISYSQGGKQYIAIIASHRPNNTMVATTAAADAATRYRRIGTTLYVFKLPG
jgi:alcohol dehydrogenase (cytochrome c)